MNPGARHRGRGAYSLIELLVVVAIMVVLAGLILAAVGAFTRNAKKAKTTTIMETVQVGLELAIAGVGSSISFAPHPFAGSAAPRLPFRGTRGRTLNADLKPIGGAIVDIDQFSEGLVGAPEWALTSDQQRCLMDDDWMADARVPMFYGLKRGYMKILGGEMPWVVDHRRLPTLGDPTTILPGPYTAPLYPDHHVGVGVERDNKSSLDYCFGSSSASSELASSGALYSPTDAELADATHLIFGDRVWSKEGQGLTGQKNWAPGLIKDGVLGDGLSTWKSYRIRGLWIYDAWGHEILASKGNGGLRLMSAGQDGCFVIDPGPNKRLDTAADTAIPAGDDSEGVNDNIRVGPLE